MIEVLVSMLILLVGLLGIASTQLLSVQNNQGAFLRTQATYIASDFLDRIRANRKGYQDGDYDSIDTSDTPTKPGCVTSTGGCSASELAQQDILELTSNFSNVFGVSSYKPSLPLGGATVAKNTVAGVDEFVVTVFWNEKDWETNADGKAERGGDIQRSVQLRTVLR